MVELCNIPIIGRFFKDESLDPSKVKIRYTEEKPETIREKYDRVLKKLDSFSYSYKTVRSFKNDISVAETSEISYTEKEHLLERAKTGIERRIKNVPKTDSLRLTYLGDNMLFRLEKYKNVFFFVETLNDGEFLEKEKQIVRDEVIGFIKGGKRKNINNPPYNAPEEFIPPAEYLNRLMKCDKYFEFNNKQRELIYGTVIKGLSKHMHKNELESFLKIHKDLEEIKDKLIS